MIYLVIPVHNRKHYTRRCLACLRMQTGADFRVVVVDDGSTDGTAEMIRNEFPEVIVLTGTGSLWWTGATNLGIRYVLEDAGLPPCDFILTLNDDTEVGPGYVASLLDAWQRHQPCVVGSVSVDIRNPDRLLYAGTRLDWTFARMTDLARTRYQNRYDRLDAAGPGHFSDSLPGRGTLIHRSVFETIGLFDERHFPHYMADLDFSIRAQRAGFPLFVSTNSIVYEHAETTGLLLDEVTSWRLFRESLVSMRSPAQLKIRYHFARLHAPVAPLYFVFDVGRIVAGYVLRRSRGFLRR